MGHRAWQLQGRDPQGPTHLILALGVHQACLQHVQGLAQDCGTSTLGGNASPRGCHVRCLGTPQSPLACPKPPGGVPRAGGGHQEPL